MKIKRNLSIAILSFSLFFACGKKTDDAESKKEVVQIKDTLTDFDRYEGKIVMGSNNQWYLIKDGLRWRTNSVEASADYLKTIPESAENVVKNVPIQTLQQFPEVGEIFPKLVFKKDEKKTAN
jgi:hypothetical protein